MEYCTNHVLRAVVQAFVPEVVLEAVAPEVVVLVSAVGAAVVGRE